MSRPNLTAEQGNVLLAIARNSIETELLNREDIQFKDAWLDEKGASFVTLQVQEKLHGCIGSIKASQSWKVDVAQNAKRAAFQDPRFPALRASDLPHLRVEVSCLSEKEEIFPKTRQELEEILRPGIDGILIEDGHHGSTFLPQVWSTLPSVSAFLDHLFLKAGLSPNHWSESLRVWTYQVQKWTEE